RASTAPANQIATTSHADPRSPARKPVVVKIPVPIMFETTIAVALKTPSSRSSFGWGMGYNLYHKHPSALFRAARCSSPAASQSMYNQKPARPDGAISVVAAE